MRFRLRKWVYYYLLCIFACSFINGEILNSNNLLPDCNLEGESEKNFFVISTLDGKISVVEAIFGRLKWSTQIDSVPLMSSTIKDFIVNHKGEMVRILPSLDGNLYAHTGNSIKQTPFSAEKLLKNSFKFSENVLLVGGQENKIIGLNLNNGKVVYDCGFAGCSKNTNESKDNIILLQKTTQSVRAVNVLTGEEEWHFVVNNPHILDITDQQCHHSEEDEIESSKYSIQYKVLVPKGRISSLVYYSNNSVKNTLYKSWNLKFDSPIVNMWHFENKQFRQINLFDPEIIAFDVDRLNPQLQVPHYYIGFYNDYFYLQKSLTYIEDSLPSIGEIDEIENSIQPETGIIQIGWKNDSDTSDNQQNTSENFGVIAKTILPLDSIKDLSSPFGYYIYQLNHSVDQNKCFPSPAQTEKISDQQNETQYEVYIINEIVYASLSYYWREIVAICIGSWILLNFVLSVCKKYGYNLIMDKIFTQNVSNSKDEVEDQRTNAISKLQATDVNATDSKALQQFNSRFLQDFEEICMLGRGGFGMVFEAKHKIDESYYAVKRVTIPVNEEKRHRFMREIKALSKLEHGGIVRYYSAWIEEPPPGWQEQQDKANQYDLDNETLPDTFDMSHTFDYTPNPHNSNHLNFDLDISNSHQIQDSLEIVFEDNTDQKLNVRSTVSLATHIGCQDSSESESSCQSDSSKEISKRENLKVVPKVYVYIQMQLCKKETLKDWIFCNKTRDKSQVIRIFNQIIDAVTYVHSNKLIHRDLKPSNIFFSMDGLIKIGDFGLVTDVLDDLNLKETCKTNPKIKLKHTNHVGTQLYMSPEQVRNEPYDHKVDIYSMGIILYELLTSFNTEFERIQRLQEARNKKFPNDFIENNTREYEILAKLLSSNPIERPESSELLKYDIFQYC